ncbi:hypothetical protein [Pararcticibacter amylolyticus]|uniref:DUF4328 domain-containing protein n=1 Tax=Pararcticibacter amylolyticus TaxID=2173175 RepID=A0A2U2PMM9_9SPHI|nr:hypothetical protein [Pararcticibacter amylolyticus]PWG82651.1 hypothetical protein DDR33_01980 [Pararcticibacter amylolyticus]
MQENLLTSGWGAVVAFAALVMTILFYLTLYTTLNIIKTENRKLHPLTVWLLFIPGFNLVWNFFVVSGVSVSIKNELQSRNYDLIKRPAFVSGIVYAILAALGIIPLLLKIPFNLQIPETWMMFFSLLGLLQIFSLIDYWRKVNWYMKIIRNENNLFNNEEEDTKL